MSEYTGTPTEFGRPYALHRDKAYAHPNEAHWQRLLTMENKAVVCYRTFFRKWGKRLEDSSVVDAVRRLETVNRIMDVMVAEGISIPFSKLQQDSARTKTSGKIVVSDFALRTQVARIQRGIVDTVHDIHNHLHWESPITRQFVTELLEEESKSYREMINAIRHRYVVQL